MASRSTFRFTWDFSRRLLQWSTWIPVVVTFNNYVAETTFIKGGSMYPFFNEDRESTLRRDLTICWKLFPEDGLKKGMIVVFKSPRNPENISVKRIVALEGDRIYPRDPLRHTLTRVPKGHVWVEGDAGSGLESLDSHEYGPISTRLVTGRLTHIIYPWKKFGRIRWQDGPEKKKSAAQWP